MVVWWLVELKPNCQHHGMYGSSNAVGVVLGPAVKGTRPLGPKFIYKNLTFVWVPKSETEQNCDQAYF